MNVTAVKDLPKGVPIVSIIIIFTCLIVICCSLKGWIRCSLFRILTTRKSQILNMQQSYKEQDINLHEYYYHQLRHKEQEVLNIEHETNTLKYNFKKRLVSICLEFCT